MASQFGDSAEGRAMNEWIRRGPMGEMAKELGISELPMRKPEFDFYGHAVYQLKQMGFKGQELFHTAHEVMQILFFNIGKAKQVPIYQYVKWYEDQVEDGKTPQPFDDYYKWAFKQKANTQLAKAIKRKKRRGPSIGQGEEEGMVGEETLGETGPSQVDVYDRKDMFQKIREKLVDKRNGTILVAVLDLLREGYNYREIAEEMNDRGIRTPKGNEWGTGFAERVRNEILRHAKEILEAGGTDWQSLVSSRKRGFRFGLVPGGLKYYE